MNAWTYFLIIKLSICKVIASSGTRYFRWQFQPSQSYWSYWIALSARAIGGHHFYFFVLLDIANIIHILPSSVWNLLIAMTIWVIQKSKWNQTLLQRKRKRKTKLIIFVLYSYIFIEVFYFFKKLTIIQSFINLFIYLRNNSYTDLPLVSESPKAFWKSQILTTGHKSGDHSYLGVGCFICIIILNAFNKIRNNNGLGLNLHNEIDIYNCSKQCLIL